MFPFSTQFQNVTQNRISHEAVHEIRHKKYILDQADLMLTPRNRNYKIKQFRAPKFLIGKVDQKWHFQKSRNTSR